MVGQVLKAFNQIWPWQLAFLCTTSCSQFQVLIVGTRNQDLWDASEEPARELSQVAPTILERRFVQQEALLLQQVGFELATLAPLDWTDASLRTGPGQRSAARDTISHLANQQAAAHFHSVPFSVAAKASSVGISARRVIDPGLLPYWHVLGIL